MPDHIALCGICGEPMPENEEMFKYHGYSGNCPKPPLKKLTPTPLQSDSTAAIRNAVIDECQGKLYRMSVLYENITANKAIKDCINYIEALKSTATDYVVISREEFEAVLSSLNVLAKIPLEDFGEPLTRPETPLMGWNKYKIYVSDVHGARAALSKLQAVTGGGQE
jgi:hypothetical protein